MGMCLRCVLSLRFECALDFEGFGVTTSRQVGFSAMHSSGNKPVATGPSKTGTHVKRMHVSAKFSIGGVAQILRTRAVFAYVCLWHVKKFQ
jgi:hypothetical protein